VTFPTGTPPESATKPLATDATGVGAYQGSLGVSVEQAFGPWLVSTYGIGAERLARTARGVHERLGTQFSLLGAVAYVFPTNEAVALVASYTFEGNATVDGIEQDATAHRLTVLSAAGVVPVDEHLRFQGALTFTPPVSGLGENQIASAGLAFTTVYAWF